MSDHPHSFPKLHNAAWPGVVGKDPDSDQPPIELDTMLDLTAAAEVDGVKFDGFDLFLFDPHISIDASDDDVLTIDISSPYEVLLGLFDKVVSNVDTVPSSIVGTNDTGAFSVSFGSNTVDGLIDAVSFESCSSK